MLDGLFDDAQRHLLATLPVRVAHVTRGAVPDAYLDIDGDYETWFRSTGLRAFLQRPDGYVFGAVTDVDRLPALLDLLADRLHDNGWPTGEESDRRGRSR